jgi:hypothetical protein
VGDIVGGSTASERGLQPPMSKQHSNAAGRNAAIGKIQYRLLEFSMDYAGFVYSETNLLAAECMLNTISFPVASRSWAIVTSRMTLNSSASSTNTETNFNLRIFRPL